MIDNIKDYKINNITVRVTYRDITSIKADVRVSSDDSILSMSSDVSVALLRAGGEKSRLKHVGISISIWEMSL